MKITPLDIAQLVSYVFNNNESYAGFYARFCRYFEVNETVFSNILHEYFEIASTVIPDLSPESTFTSETILRMIKVTLYEQNNGLKTREISSDSSFLSGGTLVGKHLLCIS